MTAVASIKGGPGPCRVVAVIDIGSTSMRMEIAQVDADRHVHALETLQQPVALGTDSFTGRMLSRHTIEECVRALQQFLQVIREYGIDFEKNVRAVATSAVREAGNRDELIDRLYIATGIQVEVLEEADVSRLTYLGVLPLLESRPALARQSILIVEVGGGSTELLLLESGVMTYSGVSRLGAQRMRQMLDTIRTPARRMRSVMEAHIQRSLEEILRTVPWQGSRLNLLVMGGEARFAASQIHRDWDQAQAKSIRLKDLDRLTDDITSMTGDEIVQRYQAEIDDSALIGPSLLILVQLAKTFQLSRVLVTPITLRDGLVREMTMGDEGAMKFAHQVIQSALDLGRKFHFDEAHGTHVAELSLTLFDQLEALHRLAPRYRLLLEVAALLHEVGLVVSTRSHHKHSMYLIANSDIFGLSSRDLQLVAITARYHRRAAPRAAHEGYALLDREERVVVCKMASLLRVADALDRVHHQHIRHLECRTSDAALNIYVTEVDDLTLEQVALKQKGRMFEQVFGQTVHLLVKRPQDHHGTAI